MDLEEDMQCMLMGEYEVSVCIFLKLPFSTPVTCILYPKSVSCSTYMYYRLVQGSEATAAYVTK